MQILKADIESVDLVVPLFDLYRKFYEQISDDDSARDFLLQRINRNESVIFLALDEDKNLGIGFVQLYPSFSSVSLKRVWILNDLFVHEDYRNQGVAGALVEKSKELALKTKAKGIVLEAHCNNINAQKLYEKIGFNKDEEHFFYFFEAEKKP